MASSWHSRMAQLLAIQLPWGPSATCRHVPLSHREHDSCHSDLRKSQAASSFKTLGWGRHTRLRNLLFHSSAGPAEQALSWRVRHGTAPMTPDSLAARISEIEIRRAEASGIAVGPKDEERIMGAVRCCSLSVPERVFNRRGLGSPHAPLPHPRSQGRELPAGRQAAPTFKP